MMDSGMDMSNSDHPFWSMVVKDLFLKRWNGLHAFGPFIAPNGKETFCTHLGIWVKPSNELDLFTQDGLNLENVRESYTDIQGTEVENVWGFVMNYLDWTELKKRSNIYERFGSVGMDFELRRREEDVDLSLGGPQGEPTKHYALLAKSEGSDLLNEKNSILIETESLHGIWQNRVGIAGGWDPEWWWPAVASVIAVSILLGLLTASTLVKSQQNRDLTEKMMPKKAIKKLHRGQTVIEKYNLVTIFYADVVGFSGSKKGRGAHNLSPTQVMNVLNDLYSALDEIAQRHGVYKVETVGNRYMVVGGALKQESARAAAKRVALFAIDAMAFVDNSFLTSHGDKVYLRAGMSSGPAVAGVVGKTMPRYCFFGDTIDRASRLEKTSKKMKIQCCEVSHRLLNDAPGMKFVMDVRTNKVGANKAVVREDDNGATYWVEKASPCENCFELAHGSWMLDPCGHVLCANCNEKHNLNVCPTCRSKVDDRTEWKGEGPHKIVDIDEASFVLPDLEEGGSEVESDNQ
jgi:atrial natriuretic peptide receptor A